MKERERGRERRKEREKEGERERERERGMNALNVGPNFFKCARITLLRYDISGGHNQLLTSPIKRNTSTTICLTPAFNV